MNPRSRTNNDQWHRPTLQLPDIPSQSTTGVEAVLSAAFNGATVNRRWDPDTNEPTNTFRVQCPPGTAMADDQSFESMRLGLIRSGQEHPLSLLHIGDGTHQSLYADSVGYEVNHGVGTAIVVRRPTEWEETNMVYVLPNVKLQSVGYAWHDEIPEGKENDHWLEVEVSHTGCSNQGTSGVPPGPAESTGLDSLPFAGDSDSIDLRSARWNNGRWPNIEQANRPSCLTAGDTVFRAVRFPPQVVQSLQRGQR